MAPIIFLLTLLSCNVIINKNMQNRPRFNNLSLFSQSNSTSALFKETYRMPPSQSLRKSRNRQPIFGNSSLTNFKLSSKPTKKVAFIEDFTQDFHIQHISYDDYCQCYDLMEPCPIIKSVFLKNVSVKEMKRQYEMLSNQTIKDRHSMQQLKNYMKLLPQLYPQLLQTHLTNLYLILQPLNRTQFTTLSWILFHCKLEHIAYFLYSDLKQSSSKKAKFLDSLDINLIKYETNFECSMRDIRRVNPSIDAFLDEYIDGMGAILVPLSQYARFLGLLLRKGIKVMVKLIAMFMSKKRNQLVRLLKYYSINKNYIQKSRQLNWQIFFDELQTLK